MPEIKVTSFGKLLIDIDGLILQVGSEDPHTKFEPNSTIIVSDKVLATIKRDIRRGIRRLIENKPPEYFSISSKAVDMIDISKEEQYNWTEELAWESIEEGVYAIYEQYDKKELVNIIIEATHITRYDKLHWIQNEFKDQTLDNSKLLSAVKFLEEL